MAVSQSIWFRPLNDLATSYAMRQLIPDINNYVADGGVKWAKQYFECVDKEAFFHQVLNGKSVGGPLQLS